MVSLLTTLILVSFVWMMDPAYITSSLLKGTLISVDILLIVFGALLFIQVLNKNKIIGNLCFYLSGISKDYRIQIILLAWFLENFLEGTSGFGTPITIVTPILVGLGLSPFLAVTIALLGNGAAGVFGAAGTPIRVGFAGLDTSGVPFTSALLNLSSSIVPLIMLFLITRAHKNGIKHFLEAAPFALFSGFAFTVPSILLIPLGQEFPSILGSVIGLIVTLLAIKLGLFLPATIRALNPRTAQQKLIPLKKVLSPYIILIGLLILAKFGLSGLSISFEFGLKHSLNIFNPGLIFIFTSVIVSLLWKKPLIDIPALKKIAISSFDPFIVVTLISAMVQLMINSNHNFSGNLSFLQYISANLQTSLLPLFTPYLGAFGSFLTGSATISNLMFGGILQSLSINSGFAISLILSLQMVGAAAGNIISLADVLPALTVVNIRGQEIKVIKQVIIPCLIYVTIASLIGLAISSL